MYKLLFILLFIYSCSDDNSLDNQEQDSSIRGYVLDASNNPIANADVYITYDMYTIPSRPSTTISFNIVESSNVSIWIEDGCDTVKTLVDSFIEAGAHTTTWDTTNDNGERVLDGVYILHLTDGSTYHDQMLLLQYIGEGYQDCDLEKFPEGCKVVATTNTDGYFEFSQECISLAFGYSSTITDEFGNEIGHYTIPRTLRIFVESEAGNKLTDLFDVDIDNGAEVLIQLDD